LVRFGVTYEVRWALRLLRQLLLEVVLFVDIIEDLDRLLLGFQVFEGLLNSEPVDHAVRL